MPRSFFGWAVRANLPGEDSEARQKLVDALKEAEETSVFEEYRQINQELAFEQQDLQEARRSGVLLLSAAEAAWKPSARDADGTDEQQEALAPLMVELARERESTDYLLPPVLSKEDDEAKEADAKLSSREAMEAEIKHLQLDIEHFKNSAVRLQAEDFVPIQLSFWLCWRRECDQEKLFNLSEKSLSLGMVLDRQRFHVLSSLRDDLQEASEELGYQRERARHHEAGRADGRVRRSAQASSLEPAGSAGRLKRRHVRPRRRQRRGFRMRRRHQRGASFAVVRSGCNLKLVPFEGGLHCDGRAPGPVHTATPLDMHNFGADFDYEGAIFGIQEFYQTCEFERARRRNLQLKRFWWRRGLEEEQEEALARDELALTSRVPIPEAAPRNPHRQELVALERRLRDLEEERFCWREAQDLQEHIAYLQDEIDAILHEQDLHRRIRTLALEREAMLDSQELRRSRLQQLRDAEKQQELRQRLRACVAEKKALQREQDDLERSYRSSQLTTWQKEKELQHRQKVLDRHSLRMQAPKKPPGRPLSAPGGRRPTPATSCGGSGDFYAWRHSSGVPLKPSARAPAHWAPGPRSPQSQAGTLPRQVRLQEPLAETDQTQLPLAVAQEASDAANQVNQEPEKPADPPKDVPSPAGPPKDAPAPDGPPKDAPCATRWPAQGWRPRMRQRQMARPRMRQHRERQMARPRMRQRRLAHPRMRQHQMARLRLRQHQTHQRQLMTAKLSCLVAMEHEQTQVPEDATNASERLHPHL
ncbi:unnamed protein product [Effrenium voratum]|uniref:Uncharacterized protein n=1 Tax=Effrenium voratum TaxID=2562239 RepID=A0AA36HUR3_9DINO|nr:unnamed protein product [Effrenium voratum]